MKRKLKKMTLKKNTISELQNVDKIYGGGTTDCPTGPVKCPKPKSVNHPCPKPPVLKTLHGQHTC